MANLILTSAHLQNPVSDWKNKNQFKPLEEYVGQSPGVRLPLWPYKSKLLTSKPKACHHLLAEGSHTLQGDKPYDKLGFSGGAMAITVARTR